MFSEYMYAHVYGYFNIRKIIYRNILYMCSVYDIILLNSKTSTAEQNSQFISSLEWIDK